RGGPAARQRAGMGRGAIYVSPSSDGRNPRKELGLVAPRSRLSLHQLELRCDNRAWQHLGGAERGLLRSDVSSSGPRTPVFDPALPCLVSRAPRRWVSRLALAALE